MDAEQTHVGLEHALRTLKRWAWLIVLCVVLTAVAAFAFSKHQTNKYTATASLLFHNNQLGQQAAGFQAAGNNETQQAQENTNVKLVQLRETAQKTAAQLGHGLTAAAVHADLEVSAAGESNIVEVSATATSPALAAAIANTYVRVFEAKQQKLNHAYYAAALRLVNKQLAALSPKERAGTSGLALRQRAQSLGVLAEQRNPNVEVAQIATVPTSPSSPKVTRNTILGAVLGLLLGLGIAFLLQRMDRRLREPEELEKVYGLPLLGVVPASKALDGSSRKHKGSRREILPPAEAETFQLVRAHLRYFNVDREIRTVLIASAGQGDGKTTIALNLAAAAARAGSVVLLVEADLREPTIAARFDLDRGPGLADVLIGSLSLWKATQTIDLDRQSGAASQKSALDVLVAGAPPPPNPAELIESQAMEAVLEEASSTYDLVLIDTPPLVDVSDAFPLLPKVDGVVIVGRVGRSRRDVAERVHQTLAGARAPLLGVIANGLKEKRESYGYSDGYGYGDGDGDGAHERRSPESAGVSSNGASAALERAPSQG